jgi:hypothetical protein
MKNFLPKFLSAFFLFLSTAQAQEAIQYPNIMGNVLFQVQADRVLSSKKEGVSPNNSFVYSEAKFGLNFNKNWSIQNEWRLQPHDVFTTRDSSNPERYRTFLSSERGLTTNNGLIIEELKLQFKNEDMIFQAGKFDPTFGSAWKKPKRIGVFTAQFAEDYNLREKIGGSISALLENSKITVNSFFNDTTGLSGSALQGRPTAKKGSTAGSTNTLDSYSVAMDGKDLFGVDHLSYNFGFRSLSISGSDNIKREKGYVFGSEYLYNIGDTSIIPFVELVKINNFTGEQGRNATYATIALIGKYSSWTGSVSNLNRIIKTRVEGKADSKSNQMDFSIGYKFTNNVTLDVTRANIKEDGDKASLFGVVASYVYQF